MQFCWHGEECGTVLTMAPIDTAASGPSWTLSPDRTMMCARDFGRHHGRRGLAAEPARHHDRR